MPYTNKLYLVDDEIHQNAYASDIDDQGTFSSTTNTINTANNYGYDKLGNLIRDNAEQIASIQWDVTGKIKSITRSTGSKKADLVYGYDASGTRLFKVVIPKQQNGSSTGTRMSQEHWDTTWYIKDASGNAMATYKTTHTRIYTAQPQNSTLKKQFFTEELYIYGSNRHGMLKANEMLSEKEYALSLGQYVVPDSTFPQVQEGVFETISSTQTITVNYTQGQFTFARGAKQYELSNHLGNVLVTVSDRKSSRASSTTATLAEYYVPYVLTISDYYAFGSSIKERTVSFSATYRYGFNNQEQDTEMGEYYAFEYRIHDARLGRFLSVDPLAPEYPWNSTYAFAENAVIWAIDLEGCEQRIVIKSCGKVTGDLKASDHTAEEWRLTSLQYLEMLRYSLNPQNKFYNWQAGKKDYFNELELQHQGGRLAGNGAFAAGILTIDYCKQTGPDIYYSSTDQQIMPQNPSLGDNISFTLKQANKLWFAPTDDRQIQAFRASASGYIEMVAAAFLPVKLKNVISKQEPISQAIMVSTDICMSLDALTTSICDGQDGLIQGGIGNSGDATISAIHGFLSATGSFKSLSRNSSLPSVLKEAFTVLAAGSAVVEGTEQVYQSLMSTTGGSKVSESLTGVSAKVCTNSGNLHYRSSSGLNSRILGKLPSSSSVTLTGATDGLWVEAIVKPGQTAWIHGAYLRKDIHVDTK